MSMGPKPEGATMIFVFGLLGLLVCPLLRIFAWIQGNGYEAKCRAMAVEPEGLAVAGRILGMIACILFLLGMCIWALVICVGVMGAVGGVGAMP